MALRIKYDADSTAQAIDFAADNKAREINGSWGIWPWYARNQTVAGAVKRASDKNLLMVMAAGNTNQTDGLGVPLNDDNDKKPIYPQSEVLPNVINVTATGYSDQQVERFGKYTVDLAAPSGLISPSYLPSGYFAIGQTSGAAPHVTGAIALLPVVDLGRSVAGVEGQMCFRGPVERLPVVAQLRRQRSGRLCGQGRSAIRHRP
jgi:subtilisin family serine protease